MARVVAKLAKDAYMVEFHSGSKPCLDTIRLHQSEKKWSSAPVNIYNY